MAGLVTKSTFFDRFGVVMSHFNQSFAEVVAQKTFAEWETIFKRLDVWYIPVNMVPQALALEQAHEIGVYDTPGQITMPIFCYGFCGREPFPV